MDFTCRERRHQAWLDAALARALEDGPRKEGVIQEGVIQDDVVQASVRDGGDLEDGAPGLPLPEPLRESRRDALRGSFWRHARIAVRHPRPDTRLRRAGFVASQEKPMLEILERLHAAFLDLGVAEVESGLGLDGLEELALFQTATTIVWINNAIHRGTLHAENGRDLLAPALWQIRHVMRLLRDEPAPS